MNRVKASGDLVFAATDDGILLFDVRLSSAAGDCGGGETATSLLVRSETELISGFGGALKKFDLRNLNAPVWSAIISNDEEDEINEIRAFDDDALIALSDEGNLSLINQSSGQVLKNKSVNSNGVSLILETGLNRAGLITGGTDCAVSVWQKKPTRFGFSIGNKKAFFDLKHSSSFADKAPSANPAFCYCSCLCEDVVFVGLGGGRVVSFVSNNNRVEIREDASVFEKSLSNVVAMSAVSNKVFVAGSNNVIKRLDSSTQAFSKCKINDFAMLDLERAAVATKARLDLLDLTTNQSLLLLIDGSSR